MTERPGQDTATGDRTPEGAAGPGPESEGPLPSRPASRPSPTSRARRTAAAAAPEGLRRPRPAPRPATAVLPGAATTEEAAPTTGEATQPTQPTQEAVPATPGATATTDDAGSDSGVPAWLVAVVAVLVLALAVLDGWLLVSRPGSGSRAQREQALSTAKTAVPLILSYDYRRFDSDVTAARTRLTGRAVDDYVKAMTTTIRPTATKVHAVVQAQTDGAGVEAVSGNGDQVTLVVFGQQKVTNTSLTAPRIDLFRVRVTLDRVHGQWLVSKFDQI